MILRSPGPPIVRTATEDTGGNSGLSAKQLPGGLRNNEAQYHHPGWTEEEVAHNGFDGDGRAGRG
jgi:hypothetical protein